MGVSTQRKGHSGQSDKNSRNQRRAQSRHEGVRDDVEEDIRLAAHIPRVACAVRATVASRVAPVGRVDYPPFPECDGALSVAGLVRDALDREAVWTGPFRDVVFEDVHGHGVALVDLDWILEAAVVVDVGSCVAKMGLEELEQQGKSLSILLFIVKVGDDPLRFKNA